MEGVKYLILQEPGRNGKVPSAFHGGWGEVMRGKGALVWGSLSAAPIRANTANCIPLAKCPLNTGKIFRLNSTCIFLW